jgi:hypothetical protein
MARAAARAADTAPIIADLQAAGVTSLNGIATALNARGVQTPRGRSRWYASQVGRLLGYGRYQSHASTSINGSLAIRWQL